MRLRSVLFVSAVLALTAVAAPAVVAFPADGAQAATGSASTAPVDTRDFPDPAVISTGAGYYAYATGSHGTNLQVMSSPDLIHWGPITDPLLGLPKWATSGLTWAPGVAYIGGQYVMYYTTTETASGDQCISVATSPVPGGPFVDSSSGHFICQTDKGGSIDANPIVVNGVPYLLWKSDDNHLGSNHPTHLWSQQLNPDGLSLVSGAPTLLLTGSLSNWQKPVTEGPTMVAAPGGGFDLFYGAGWWNTTSAGIGYATCPSPLAPCTNRSTSQPWMATNPWIEKNGPSGPDVFTDKVGQLHIAYHAWGAAVGYPAGQRMLWIDTLSFKRSGPSVP